MDIFFATPLVIKPDGGVCGGGSWLAGVLGNTSSGEKMVGNCTNKNFL